MAKTKEKKSKVEAKQEVAVTRPEQLAKELNVSGKQIRAFLRSTFGDSHEKRTSWLLTPSMAQAVRDRFTPSEDDEDAE